MKKNISLSICFFFCTLSFLTGFFIKNFIDNKKFVQINKNQAGIKKLNENLIKENKFLNELNDIILNQDNLIDKEEKECLSNSISTADSLNYIYNAEKNWNIEITKYLNLLKTVMPHEEYKIIEKNHNMWLEQNKKDNAIIDKFIFNHGGTMYQQIGAEENVKLKKQRRDFLKEIYDCYTNDAAGS